MDIRITRPGGRGRVGGCLHGRAQSRRTRSLRLRVMRDARVVRAMSDNT